MLIFHDFPGLENGLPKLQDFPGTVVTLNQARSQLVSHRNSRAT